MKKITLVLASLCTLAVLAPAATVSAATTAPTKTTVSGVISRNNKPVKNADVTVICNNIAKYAMTNNAGQYNVTYGKDKCAPGATVNVTATKNRRGGVANFTMPSNGAGVANVTILNVAVPEFGLVTGFGAAIVGGGAFLYIRRRQNTNSGAMLA